MRQTRRAFLTGAVAALAAGGAGLTARAGGGAGSGGFPTSLLIIDSAGGRHAFRVELADTPARRTQGLQHRRSLAPDAGMLFLFDRPQAVSMWMKDTLIALDMLFIGAEGVIRQIAADSRPLSLRVISSPGAVKAVLEVRAGTAARLGIRPGDRVAYPALARKGGDSR